MTQQPENVDAAIARAEQLKQDAEQFVAGSAAPRTPDEDATKPMSLADLLAVREDDGGNKP